MPGHPAASLSGAVLIGLYQTGDGRRDALSQFVHEHPYGWWAIASVWADQVDIEFRNLPFRQDTHEFAGRQVLGALNFTQMGDPQARCCTVSWMWVSSQPWGRVSAGNCPHCRVDHRQVGVSSTRA